MGTAYTSEAELIADFISRLDKKCWTVYPETSDWDLLLVHEDGYQVGLEAKLVLNAKVVDQALDRQHTRWGPDGPDYRGVLVPRLGKQAHIGRICDAIGLGVVTMDHPERGVIRWINLPNESYAGSAWPNWCPSIRCPLPDYVPDVSAGHKSPVKLTDWKIKAIKLMILLERFGSVTRADMRALQISPSRWTDCYIGYLDRTPDGYVRNRRTPDFKAQHPLNWQEIEADFNVWAKDIRPVLELANASQSGDAA